MTQPTDADRQRAHDIILASIGHTSVHFYAAMLADIATAIAAARAEGFEAGLREPERRAREFLGDPAKGVSGHGK